jgi:hypothetical protein
MHLFEAANRSLRDIMKEAEEMESRIWAAQ